MDKTGKRLLHEAHNMAKALHKVGAMDLITMRVFDALCLSPIHDLPAKKIKSIREHAHISQPVFAKIINVSLAAVKQWERGERKPSGAALKLLILAEKKGIESII
ncbi:MAG TPA: helix-turn-helix domain-containing protein [Gammaproteobacteria bacterium]|nr:helix-turn-helix domain-containing protein [Gammaproteobacteria bacterium]